MNQDALIARQLEFVEWLKSKGLYNRFASANRMQAMMDVWEACKAEQDSS